MGKRHVEMGEAERRIRKAERGARVTPRTGIPGNEMLRCARLLESTGHVEGAAELRRRARGEGSWWTTARLAAHDEIATAAQWAPDGDLGGVAALLDGATRVLLSELVTLLGDRARITDERKLRLTRALVLAVEVLREERAERNERRDDGCPF